MIARPIALLVLALTAGAAAQDDPWATFDAAYRRAESLRAEAGDEAAVARAYGAALEAFRAVPAATAGRDDWLTVAAFCARRSGDVAAAADLYAEAIEAGAGGAFAVQGRLEALLALGEPSRAIDAARRLFDDAPDAVRRFLADARATHGTVLMEEAAGRLRAGEVEAGVFVFEQIAEATGDPLDVANLALTMRFLGRFDEADALYRSALEERPDDDVLWNDYGLCLKAAGRMDDALAAFARSLEEESAPGMGPATTNLAYLRATGRSDALQHPLRALSELLSRRPATEMARRLCIDAVLSRAASGRDAVRRDAASGRDAVPLRAASGRDDKAATQR